MGNETVKTSVNCRTNSARTEGLLFSKCRPHLPSGEKARATKAAPTGRDVHASRKVTNFSGKTAKSAGAWPQISGPNTTIKRDLVPAHLTFTGFRAISRWRELREVTDEVLAEKSIQGSVIVREPGAIKRGLHADLKDH